MSEYGYFRVASAIPNIKVADCNHNVDRIIDLSKKAFDKGAKIVSFPELSITGYTCGDLFAQSFLIENAELALKKLLESTAGYDIIIIVGMPVESNGTLLNTAVTIQKGNILGVTVKTYLPNYKEFYEKRWFASSLQCTDRSITLCGQTVPMGANLIFKTSDASFAIEICEDLWATIPPSSNLALSGAEIIFNLSADNEVIGKHEYLLSLISQQASRCICGYVFSSSGFGESTTDLVFAGNAIINEAGEELGHSKRFCMDEQIIMADIDIDKIRNDRRINTTFAESRGIHSLKEATIIPTYNQRTHTNTELLHKIEPYPFIPKKDQIDNRCEDILEIQANGLAKRILHTNCKSLVIGISGGLDSTWALLIGCITFDKLKKSRKGIIGVTMPGFGTTDRTHDNAYGLMKSLGITIREVSIKDSCIQHFKDIEHDINVHDTTYENSQARERTQILMDIANQTGGLVLGTGDLSELALGWATYNGDHMSMYGINASIPKTLIRYLIEWFAKETSNETERRILLDIIDTPISPELIPADNNGNIKQKTEDLVGPYDLHDFFLYNFLRNGYRPAKIFFLAKIAFEGKFTDDAIRHWLRTFFRRFFNQQFKRSCLPDGPKVGLSLSPRGDWRMPSDASVEMWLNECDNL